MPTLQHTRTAAGLASELRLSVMRLRRRLAVERDPENTLSMGAMAVLGALHFHGEMTLGALAAREGVQPPSMTRTVNCLVEGDYVTRRPGETDRRLVIIATTEYGRETVLADRARREEWLARRLGELTDAERAVLRQATPLLQRIAAS